MLALLIPSLALADNLTPDRIEVYQTDDGSGLTVVLSADSGVETVTASSDAGSIGSAAATLARSGEAVLGTLDSDATLTLLA